MRRSFPAVVLAAAFLAASCPLLAHPPCERTERVLTDDEGRSFQLNESYQDGIFLTDPVRLVVRDGDNHQLVATEYGRDLAVLCPRAPTCVVFRYDGLVPILPDDIWLLEGRNLSRTRSPALLALGVLAPLWAHPGGYLFSCVTLFCRYSHSGCWPEPPARTGARPW